MMSTHYLGDEVALIYVLDHKALLMEDEAAYEFSLDYTSAHEVVRVQVALILCHSLGDKVVSKAVLSYNEQYTLVYQANALLVCLCSSLSFVHCM